MKITFENFESKQNVDKTKNTYSSRENQKTDKIRGYALDISGTVMDNTAYGLQGRTAEEVMQSAGQIDVAIVRDLDGVDNLVSCLRELGQVGILALQLFLVQAQLLLVPLALVQVITQLHGQPVGLDQARSLA